MRGMCEIERGKNMAKSGGDFEKGREEGEREKDLRGKGKVNE